MRHVQSVRQKRRDAAWEETRGVLAALGNITIGWAGINLILNVFIEGHHNQLGKSIRADLPRDFSQKLEYLKKVERDPNWQPERLAEFRQIRLALTAMNKKRVLLVHGLVSRVGYGPTWNVHFAKEEGDNLKRRDVPHTSQDFHDIAAEVSTMGGQISRFFMPILAK